MTQQRDSIQKSQACQHFPDLPIEINYRLKVARKSQNIRWKLFLQAILIEHNVGGIYRRERDIKMVLFSPEKIDHARSEEYVMFAFNDMITNSNNLSLSSVYHVPSRYFMVICLLIITTTTWSSYYYSENTDKRRNRSLDMSSICLMTHCTNTGVGARF